MDDSTLVEECKRLRGGIHTMSIENDALRVSNVNLAKHITERDNEIDVLLKKLTSIQNASTLPLWVKSVVDSNVQLKLRLQTSEKDNKVLAGECLALARVIQMKTDQVQTLKQRVQSLQAERQQRLENAAEQDAYAVLDQQFKDIEIVSGGGGGERLGVQASDDECTTSIEMLEPIKEINVQEKKEERENAGAIDDKEIEKENHLKNEQRFAASVENVMLEIEEEKYEDDDLKAENQELKELVEFLEMERMCSMEEERANAAEKSNDQIDKISLLVKQNAILKEQVEAWREGFAMKIKKEAKLLVQLTAKKDVCAKLGRLAKRQQTKRKAIERKCSKMAKRPKTTTKVSPKMNTEPRVSLTNVAALNGMSATKEIVTNSLKQDDNCKHEELELVNAINDLKLKRQIEDLEEKNQELAKLVEFLELERKCTLEENEEIRISDCQAAEKEIERIRISMKSNYDELINDYEEEKQRRVHFEKLFEQMEAKLQGMEERFDNEFQKNLELETKLLKMEETAAENSSKSSLNCFQRIFRRRRR